RDAAQRAGAGRPAGAAAAQAARAARPPGRRRRGEPRPPGGRARDAPGRAQVGAMENAGTGALPNPLRQGLVEERIPEPATMVIFGASGDLARRKLLPALYSLTRDRLLP